MIDQLLFRSSDLSLLDGDLFYSPNKIREQFTQSREKPRQEHIRELNILNNAFIFRQFVDRCHDNSDNLEPIISDRVAAVFRYIVPE